MNDHLAENASAPRPPRGAARCAEAALALAGVAWTARAVWQIRLAAAGEPASGPPDQGNGNHRTPTSLEDAYHIVSAVGDIATGLCALVFLLWLVRARDNARALSGERPRYSWPWIYLGWIVPVANLWVPRGIVADVHRASAPGEPLPRALNWWWGLWLTGMLSGAGLMYADSTDEVIARAYTDIWQLLLSDAVVVAAAVAGVLVVRAVTVAQTGRTADAVRHDTAPAA
ncbi:DUF4328 domain-containing protein [Streptomyces yerevanensis]|uniref:DUF4328 domain-containing protein n=1 Tax=Streptomyces yerevanensis TaxID=66378 RepID=UPI00068C8239|nr:DUF4328 domain-containing protein [Streptomyces yerevanensis]